MKFSLKGFTRNIFLVLIFPIFVFNAKATTYYVSTIGDDGNAGTSQDAPWQHCPGIPGWTGSATLVGGDTVYFNSADTWEVSTGDAVLQVVGGVMYDGKTWGSGSRAILRAVAELNRSVINFMEDHENIPTVVKGFEVDAGSTVTSGICANWPQSSGSMVGAKKIIEDCVVHDVASASAEGQYEYGIALSSGYGGSRSLSNVDILNCTVYNISRGGINVYSANDDPMSTISNVVVRGNEIYNTGLDPDYAGSALPMKNHVINVLFEYNYVHNATRGMGIGISSHDETFRGPENAIIRHNIIKECPQMGIVFNVKGNCSVDIYGNIIVKNTYQGIRFMGVQDTLSTHIYNNTLMHNYYPGWSHEILVHCDDNAVIEALEIKNNIFFADSGTIPLEDAKGIITDHSNNIYYRFLGGALVKAGGTSYTSDDLSTFESTALSDDPLFFNSSQLPSGFIGTFNVDMKPNTEGFNLGENSPAKDNGATLDDNFNSSINTITRPYGSEWDIGAYENTGTIGTIPQQITTKEIGGFSVIPGRNGLIISYTASKSGVIDMRIYDLLGTLVRQLTIKTSPGTHSVVWDRYTKGNSISNGCYIALVQTANKRITRRFILSQ